MHWIQTLRKDLKLTQHELAAYLRVSVHTIQSMEQCRRELPFKSMGAAIALFNAVKAGKARPVNDPPPEADSRTQRQLKGLHRRCRHRLVLCAEKLQKMLEDHENACRSLSTYELLADALATADSPDDLARLQWTKWRIQETLQRIKDNNATAQGLLTAEIAALESRKQALESMLVADTTDKKSQSDVFHHRDTDDEEQSQRSREVKTDLNGSPKTQAPCFRQGRLERVDPGPTRQGTDDGYYSNGELKMVNRAGPNHSRGIDKIAFDARFTKDIFGEALDDYTKDHNNAGNNESGVSPRSVYSRLAKPSRGQHRVGDKEPVNSG